MPQKTTSRALSPLTLSDVYLAPGHLIRRSQQIAVAIFYDEFSGYEVTPVQYATLIAIRDRPGMDQRTLVKEIAIDRSTIGSMLKILEDRELIFRITPEDNRRSKLLFITEAGNGLLKETREHIGRVQDRILGPLAANERKVFMKLLLRLVDINNEFSRAPLKVASPSTKTKSRPSNFVSGRRP